MIAFVNKRKIKYLHLLLNFEHNTKTRAFLMRNMQPPNVGMLLLSIHMFQKGQHHLEESF